jgi:hypothetical protein
MGRKVTLILARIWIKNTIGRFFISFISGRFEVDALSAIMSSECFMSYRLEVTLGVILSVRP